jgi:uncharacterized protein (DUF1697 family)
MKKYIFLLRGINVSGKNILSMSDLRQILNDLDFQNVQTYIQSGNIILESEVSKVLICEKIIKAILDKFGYEIPVIGRTIAEWEKVIEEYPFSTANEKIVAFTFLDRIIGSKEIQINNIGTDEFKLNKDVVYVYCPNGFGKSKITNNVFEKKLQVNATTRNLRTALKLLELATQ